MSVRSLTALVRKEGDTWVALCPEIDVASQGDSIEHAKANLREAVELFFECADKDEIERRMPGDTYTSRLEINVG